MRDCIIVGILIAIVFLLMKNSSENYTTNDISIIKSKFLALTNLPENDPVGKASIVVAVCNVILSQLDGSALTGTAEAYTYMNSILPKGYPPFTSEDEFDQVTTAAYKYGEPKSYTAIRMRNRVALRLIAWPCILVLDSNIPFLPVTSASYSPDGAPIWTGDILMATDQPSKDVLQFGFTVILQLYTILLKSNKLEDIPASFLTMVNKYLPKTLYKPYSNIQEFFVDMDKSKPPSPRAVFFTKAYTIGAAYIAWIAENKWKLDNTWDAPVVPAGQTLQDNMRGSSSASAS